MNRGGLHPYLTFGIGFAKQGCDRDVIVEASACYNRASGILTPFISAKRVQFLYVQGRCFKWTVWFH